MRPDLAPGSEYWYDAETGDFEVINDTSVSTDDVMGAVMEQHPEVAQIMRWQSGNRHHSRGGGLFERDRYVTPHRIFEQFRVAHDAMESDDVVSNVLETTEALALTRVGIEADDPDEEDVWNQIVDDLNLLDRMREIWREVFAVSNAYYSIIWKKKTYTVRGTTSNGTKRKKKFLGVNVPWGVSVLDPLKVVPVGNFMFGQEKLAYIATRDEVPHIDLMLAGANTSDLIMGQLLQAEYVPSDGERMLLAETTGVDVSYLYLMNPNNVFRVTATRPAYERFAPVRMKSLFDLLDLKAQLREMDRSALLGSTNFIVLIKKGEKDHPAKPNDLQALAGQVKASARMPVIVGDHTLSIEIITPKTDHTLASERYNNLDSRIATRLYQSLSEGGVGGATAGSRSDDSIKIMRVIARGLESRRTIIRDNIQDNILDQIMARNEGTFTSDPTLQFYPQHVAIDFDANAATYLLDLRDRGDISRDTLLGELDLEQSVEARKRERESAYYDKVFTPTIVPYSGSDAGGTDPKPPAGPDNANPEANPAPDAKAAPLDKKAAGRNGGGTSGGGGNNRNSGTSNQSRPKAPTPKPNKS